MYLIFRLASRHFSCFPGSGYPGCQRLFMLGFRFRVFKVTPSKSRSVFSRLRYGQSSTKTTKLVLVVFSPLVSSAEQREINLWYPGQVLVQLWFNFKVTVLLVWTFVSIKAKWIFNFFYWLKDKLYLVYMTYLNSKARVCHVGEGCTNTYSWFIVIRLMFFVFSIIPIWHFAR